MPDAAAASICRASPPILSRFGNPSAFLASFPNSGVPLLSQHGSRAVVYLLEGHPAPTNLSPESSSSCDCLYRELLPNLCIGFGNERVKSDAVIIIPIFFFLQQPSTVLSGLIFTAQREIITSGISADDHALMFDGARRAPLAHRCSVARQDAGHFPNSTDSFIMPFYESTTPYKESAGILTSQPCQSP